jgi:hypothetical protein
MGIDTVIVRGIKKIRIQKDLQKILGPFQKKGLAVFFTDGFETPKAVALKGVRGG